MIHWHVSFGETLGFDSHACEAEMRADGEYTPGVADGLEEAALECIKGGWDHRGLPLAGIKAEGD